MGEMGKGPVQKSIGEIPEGKVQGKA